MYPSVTASSARLPITILTLDSGSTDNVWPILVAAVGLPCCCPTIAERPRASPPSPPYAAPKVLPGRPWLLFPNSGAEPASTLGLPGVVFLPERELPKNPDTPTTMRLSLDCLRIPTPPRPPILFGVFACEPSSPVAALPMRLPLPAPRGAVSIFCGDGDFPPTRLERSSPNLVDLVKATAVRKVPYRVRFATRESYIVEVVNSRNVTHVFICDTRASREYE